MDVDSLRWQPGMTGQRERKATYPQFLVGPEGELTFTYRDGGSGNSDQIVNRYDPGVRYLLRWEARPENRDRPYPGEPPEPSMLRVYQLKLP